MAPDLLSDEFWKPKPDFVLCRDIDGNPTAVFGENTWDFNPYRLSARRISKMNFSTIAVGSPNREALVGEVKHILFLIIYTVESGRLGRLSASSVGHYFEVLRAMASFCVRQGAKPLVGELSIKQLLTNEIYLSGLIMDLGTNTRFKAKFPGLLRYLSSAGCERLGYRVLQRKCLNKREYEQHLVIPTRLYLRVINSLGELLDLLRGKAEAIENFISEFSDPFYGRSSRKQMQMGVGARHQHRPTFLVAMQLHGLEKVLVGDFYCKNRKKLSVAVASMQLVLKTIIHLYTGMRDQEIARLMYDCVIEDRTASALNEDGVETDPERIIHVVSSTTKYEGYRRQESWLATEEVLDAVSIARAICRGIAKHYNISPEECPLFLRPSILMSARAEIGVRDYYTRVNKSWRDALVISAEDLAELSATDPIRDFASDDKFAVGKIWPLKTHQFRRSLAFYASNSGFVSLPTLRVQFKQLTLEMTRYYANNFENLKTIFGYYDDEVGDFSISSSHVSLEFQMGIPISISNQIINDLFSSVEFIYGGTGSYMEKQKARIDSGEVVIGDVRRETIERARRGELCYRPTILGGCSKVGRCDFFMLGDFTACLSCEDAIIKLDKVESAIVMTDLEVKTYDPESGEYQVAHFESERLRKFRDKFCRKL